MIREYTCKERVRDSFKSRMSTIRKLYELGFNKSDPELGTLSEYGLCIDYVEPGTWSKKGQPKSEGYKRYQLSWGGPQEEFRWMDNGQLQYWFLDWFDGAFIVVKGENAEIIKNIINTAL